MGQTFSSYENPKPSILYLSKFYFDLPYFYNSYSFQTTPSIAEIIHFLENEFKDFPVKDIVMFVTYKIPIIFTKQKFLSICQTVALYQHYTHISQALYIFSDEDIKTVAKLRFGHKFSGFLDDFQKFYDSQKEKITFSLAIQMQNSHLDEFSDQELESWQFRLLKKLSLGDVNEFDYEEKFMASIGQEKVYGNEEFYIVNKKPLEKNVQQTVVD